MAKSSILAFTLLNYSTVNYDPVETECKQSGRSFFIEGDSGF